MTKTTIDDLMIGLIGSEEVANGELEVEKIEGTNPLIQATVKDFDELPVMISVGDEQILAIVALWQSDEVKADKVNELNAFLLRANLPVPLSSFSIMNDRYVIFGALSVNSGLPEIVEEIVTLANNAVEAIETCREYLAV